MAKDDVPKLSPFPKYGDLITMEHFKECCADGMFIDCDGFGYLATDVGMSDMVIRPSMLRTIKIPSWATHVMWFNR